MFIYTDGASLKKPGGKFVGGYAAILVCDGHKKIVSGTESDTTNNRMELKGVISGLEALKRPVSATIVTDSQYVMFGITKWIKNWKRSNWIGASGKPVSNRDLWEALDKQCSTHSINWQWVRGHRGHGYNEEADEIAGQAAKSILNG